MTCVTQIGLDITVVAVPKQLSKYVQEEYVNRTCNEARKHTLEGAEGLRSVHSSWSGKDDFTSTFVEIIVDSAQYEWSVNNI